MKKQLYHGSDKIVERPVFGVGREDNDYGSGFYTTEDVEKAREWAVINGTDKAFCNRYELDMTDLVTLELADYGTLAWIAEVVFHRGTRNEISNVMAERLIEKYKIDTSGADIMIGYRADDSYITVVDAFLQNELSLDEVDRLFRKGHLGKQIFIKSPKAFEQLTFVGSEEVELHDASGFGDADRAARKEVNHFLNSRRIAIQLEGFVPSGITARDAIHTCFEYCKEYSYYVPCNKD